jgi:hypothetical protein
MAGAGYKLFVTGDVLTAAQVNTYLQQQTIMVFASSAARTAALASVLSEGMFSYLTDTNSTEYYDGAAWQSISNPGDITAVTAGAGLSGGGTSGAVTLAIGTAPALNRPALTSPTEINTISATAATGTVNYDAVTQGVLYYTTNASGNFVLNARGDGSTTLSSLLAVGQSMTISFLVTNGATAYYNTSVQVDGTVTGVSTKWQGGTAPTAGNASSIDAYVYSIVKTAATPTYTVFASVTKFA